MPLENFNWYTTLERSIELNKSDPHYRFVQLASVTREGEPRNRTMVFRGFDPSDHSILLCTDRLSAKIKELSLGGGVELCWYFTTTREQYRLRGRVEIIDDPRERQTFWLKLSEETRAQFFWPPPLEDVQHEQSTSLSHHSMSDPKPPERLLLFKIKPKRVDYLLLSASHRRIISAVDGQGWSSRAVNP